MVTYLSYTLKLLMSTYSCKVPLSPNLSVYDADVSVTLFVSVLVRWTREHNLRQFHKLAKMLANTEWYNIDELTETGCVSKIHVLGFGKSARIAYRLFAESELFEGLTPTNPIRRTYDTSLAFDPCSDNEGGAIVKFNEKHQCYMHTDLDFDQEKARWFCAIHSTGLRLLDNITFNIIHVPQY